MGDGPCMGPSAAHASPAGGSWYARLKAAVPLEVKLVLKGTATYLPLSWKPKLSTSSRSARYCYAVWLRHLTMAHKQAVPFQARTVAELGPGGSLGVGLAALLSGADQYYALDVVAHADVAGNLGVLDELVDLFHRQAPIPDDSEFPEVTPHLDSYGFPSQILCDDLLRSTLHDDRVAAIRTILANPGGGQAGKLAVRYFAPWGDPDVMQAESVDAILSQAVMEHVDDLAQTYESLARWLRAGGYMSHSIDYRSHGTAREWNGHWGYPEIVWTLIKGKHRYLLNREPHSTHVRLLEQLGFQILNEMRTQDLAGLRRNQLSRRWRHISSEDLTTSTAFLQAIKTPAHRAGDADSKQLGDESPRIC